MSKEIVAILNKARDLLQRKAWIKHAAARDNNGMPVVPKPGAAAFCAFGAIRAVTRSDTRVEHAVDSLQVTLYERTRQRTNLSAWNDKPSRTKRQVLGLFDRTINRLERKESKKS